MAQRHLPALLIIMDGCGLAPADGENAVAAAKTPFLDSLYEKYPHTTLGASGEDVGLPDGQMGNSEVGHLNIGAGRIVFQELSRINNAIKDGSIAKNEVFVKAMDDVKAEGKTLHLMGLMSPGGVHSHMNHVEALVKMAAEHGVKTVRVHAFMDGRDVDPQSGAGYMSEFCAFLAKISEETCCDARVATVSGRYWAMDRDNRWSASSAPTTSWSTRPMPIPTPLPVSRPTMRRIRAATSSSSPSLPTTRASTRATRPSSSTSVRPRSSDDSRVHGQGVRRL